MEEKNRIEKKLCRDKKSFLQYFYDEKGDLYKVQLHYPTGEIRMSTAYANGMKNGSCTGYRQTGSVNMECTYLDNKLSGKYITYHPDGRIKVSAEYKDGELNGVYEEYDKQRGYLAKHLEYLNGKPNGECRFYGWNGLVRKEIFSKGVTLEQYVYCFRHGEVKLQTKCVFSLHEHRIDIEDYNPLSGVVIKSYSMLDDERHGEYKEFFKTGQLKKSCNYLNGRLVGEMNEYRIDGSLKSSKQYGY